MIFRERKIDPPTTLCAGWPCNSSGMRLLHASNVRRWIVLSLWLSVASIFLSSCGWLVRAPQDQTLARMQVQFMTEANRDLNQFKGIGNLRLETKGQVLSGRMAWAVAMPDKLRVEWLNMLGQPLSSLAGDGKAITIRAMGDRKLHRIKQSEKALTDVIHVPVGIEDLTSLLAGRLPSTDHAAAWIVQDGDADQRIELKNRWAVTVASILVDKQRRRPRSMTVYTSEGTLKYQIQWVRWQEIDERSLPRQIQMEAAGGERVTMNLDRYWFDVVLPPATFVLTVPDNE